MQHTMSYAISNQVQLSGYAADPQGDPVLIAVDDAGLLSKSTYDATELRRYVGMANVQMFDAWTVPPQNMSANGPATQGTYLISGWQAQTADPDTVAPAEAKAITFSDGSGGAFDLATGIFSVPKSGNYRHSMYMRIRGNNDGNYGIFLRVNGVRHVGDFFKIPNDAVFDNSCHSAGVLARRRR
jgi:hypothetical protein